MGGRKGKWEGQRQCQEREEEGRKRQRYIFQVDGNDGLSLRVVVNVEDLLCFVAFEFQVIVTELVKKGCK